VIDHNADYLELERLIEGRLCAVCGQPPQIAWVDGRHKIICGCPGGPFVAPRETQAQFLRRREQELRTQTRAVPSSLTEIEVTEMTQDLFGGS
jgi:hypothetical protein